jgi:hypothetical protein
VRHTLYCLFTILCISVCPAVAEVFDYKECVARGRGTNRGAMSQTAYQDYYSVEQRQAACAKIDDQEKASEARQKVIEDRRQQQRQQERALEQSQDQWKCDGSGTCASGSEVEQEIRRLRQGAQNPKAVGRSTDGTSRFVLLDEVKEPPAKRQPEISFGTQPDSSNRFVRVGAVGLTAPREVQVVCDQEVRSIPLTTTSTDNGRTVATYEASRATVSVALASAKCDLVLAGARVSIPQDKLVIVWGNSSPPANTKR